MNTFVLEIFDDQGQACTFFTVRWQDATLSETDKFFQQFRYHEQLKTPLQELATFLKVAIGDEYGALESFFRFENTAQALPPAGTHQVEDININFGNFPLRLYCLRMSESLVVLFNGGEKTAATAQAGKTNKAFQEANVFAQRILKALQEKEIYIGSNHRTFCSSDGGNEISI
ncbi:MAG TPA: hypothetical protein DCQ29_00330 [Chitinophagaceae bacterium]|nr:hypothetical protein [Chitinophagaceae bacterium]